MSESLPDDGPVTVGSVALPEGRRVAGCLWSTNGAPQDALGLWSRLAEQFGETGLWPVIVFGPYGTSDWDLEPDEVWQELAETDAETLLRARWKGHGDFPGLGHGGEPIAAAPRSAPDSVAALALVPVTRGADVPGLIGWEASWVPGTLSAVLRSWEDRYGAQLLGLAGANLYLHVRRPPLPGEDRIKAAAELSAFCSDMDDDPATMAAESLWSFWWD
jgi:hypothetical protein